MKKKEIAEFLIKLLKKRRPIKKIFLKNINNFDFIDSGQIDSLEISDVAGLGFSGFEWARAFVYRASGLFRAF